MDDKGMKNPVSGKDKVKGEVGNVYFHVRVVRGGSHDPFNFQDDPKTDVEIVSRYLEDSSIGDEITGFRVARTKK